MDRYPFRWPDKYEACDECEHRCTSKPMPTQLTLLLVRLTCLRTPQPPLPPEVSTLRLLIMVVGLVLVIMALVTTGAADQIGIVLRHWLPIR